MLRPMFGTNDAETFSGCGCGPSPIVTLSGSDGCGCGSAPVVASGEALASGTISGSGAVRPPPNYRAGTGSPQGGPILGTRCEAHPTPCVSSGYKTIDAPYDAPVAAEPGSRATPRLFRDFTRVSWPGRGLSDSALPDARACCVKPPIVVNTRNALVCGTFGAHYPEPIPPGANLDARRRAAADRQVHMAGPMRDGDRILVELYVSVDRNDYCPQCSVVQDFRIIGGTPNFKRCVADRNKSLWVRWYSKPSVRLSAPVPANDRWDSAKGRDGVDVRDGGQAIDLPPRAKCCHKQIGGQEERFLVAVDRPGGYSGWPACGPPKPRGVLLFRTSFVSSGTKVCDYQECLVDWLLLYEAKKARVRVVQAACKTTGDKPEWKWTHPAPRRVDRAPEWPPKGDKWWERNWEDLLDLKPDWRETLYAPWDRR